MEFMVWLYRPTTVRWTNGHLQWWGHNIKIPFFHKFLAALEVQFHTRLLLMMKYNECRSFGVSVFRHFEALGL